MSATAVWSDDPEFYEAILGGSDLLGQIFVKINSDASQIIKRFDLPMISDGIFIKSDRYKYICIIAENTEKAINTMKETIKTV